MVRSDLTVLLISNGINSKTDSRINHNDRPPYLNYSKNKQPSKILISIGDKEILL